MWPQIGQTAQSTIADSEASLNDGYPGGEDNQDIRNIIEDLKNVPLEDKGENLAKEESSKADEIHCENDGLGGRLEGQEPHPVDIAPYPSDLEVEPASPSPNVPEVPLYDDPSDEDDGCGEWITPSNAALHKSRALDLLPSADASRKGKKKSDGEITVGCMTADFAMQNVLLQMGLNLVGVEGKRIQKLKTWVLRCHACFK
jgi:RNA-binding protein NOB1